MWRCVWTEEPELVYTDGGQRVSQCTQKKKPAEDPEANVRVMELATGGGCLLDMMIAGLLAKVISAFFFWLPNFPLRCQHSSTVIIGKQSNRFPCQLKKGKINSWPDLRQFPHPTPSLTADGFESRRSSETVDNGLDAASGEPTEFQVAPLDAVLTTTPDHDESPAVASPRHLPSDHRTIPSITLPPGPCSGPPACSGQGPSIQSWPF